MRVLHVIPSVSPAYGGPSQAVVTMEQVLGATGVVVTTATTDDDGLGHRLSIETQPAKVNGAVRIYARKLLNFYKVAPGLLPWLWRHVRDFDVVHIHALFSFASLVAGLIAYNRGVPYVIRPFGTLNSYGLRQRRRLLKWLSLRLIEERLLRHAAAVHFTSFEEFEEAKALNIPFHGVVIPLGVEPCSPGNAQDLVRHYPILQGRLVVLYLSRLDPKKNMEGLLRAFATLEPQRTNIVLLVAGSGEPSYLASLRSLAASLDITQHVIWLGHVNGTRKAAALAVADLFVLPSFSENFGIAAAEAMFAGLPCILGRGVAIAEQVQSAGAGLAVEPEPAAIARALAGLVGDEGRRRAMGKRGRKFAQRNYSTGDMGDRLIALYQDITGREFTA